MGKNIISFIMTVSITMGGILGVNTTNKSDLETQQEKTYKLSSNFVSETRLLKVTKIEGDKVILKDACDNTYRLPLEQPTQLSSYVLVEVDQDGYIWYKGDF